MKKIVCVFMLIPFLTNAQLGDSMQLKMHADGIRFETPSNWQQILEKAKEENKFIFVDCFATWCLPCSKMASEVFTKKDVGEYINRHFISVQMQMDTSKKDSKYIESWYEEANRIKQQYKVTKYPTYLFFSQDGKIVHKFIGLVSDSIFVRLATNSLNPEKQYFIGLAEYSKGKRDYGQMKYLAKTAKMIEDDSISRFIAADYIRSYLDLLPEDKLCQKQYLDFISSFISIVSSRDRVFTVLLKKGDILDKVMGIKGYSKGLVSYIITKEEVTPMLISKDMTKGADPDWSSVFKKIESKYGEIYASYVVLNSQLTWYAQNQDWNNMIKYNVAKIERYGLDTAGVGWAMVNNIVYDVFFKHCTNRDTLTKAIKWMEMINKFHPNDCESMDTYANLLYKIGKVKSAIFWEERAAVVEDVDARREGRNASLDYMKAVRKMRNGIPTW